MTDPSRPGLPEPLLDALWALLDHLYWDERAHFFGSPPQDREDHIYRSLLLLYCYLHATDGERTGRR